MLSETRALQGFSDRAVHVVRDYETESSTVAIHKSVEGYQQPASSRQAVLFSGSEAGPQIHEGQIVRLVVRRSGSGREPGGDQVVCVKGVKRLPEQGRWLNL